MKPKKCKSFLSIRRVLTLCSSVPIIVSSIAIILFASDKFHTVMYEYRLAQLESVAMTTKMNIETHGSLYNAREYLDEINYKTGIEMTIIDGSTRTITTIKDSNGNYIAGTDIDHNIVNVLKTGNSYKNYDVTINGNKYLVIYLPLMENNEYSGAVFAGYDKVVTKHEVMTIINAFVIIASIIGIVFALLIIIVSKSISIALNKLLDNLNYMSIGNLNKVEESHPHIKEFKEIDISLLSLNSKLLEVVGNITNTAIKLDNITDSVADKCSITSKGISDIGIASDEICHSATNLASNTQRMNSDLIDISEDINSIRNKVERVYDDTKITYNNSINLVNNLGKLIGANGETKEYTNDVVKSINETAGAIDKIENAAKFIESIAEQTNLLSLNASIEAARAGEAGRGFSVVATEIKNLAEQSAKSASEVQAIIKTIMEKSNQNIVSANAIANAVESEMRLLHIVKDGVSEISEEVRNVNNDMTDVKNTTINIDHKNANILDSISSLSSISEENAAMSEETSATLQELTANMHSIDQQSTDVADQSRLLVEIIKFFKI